MNLENPVTLCAPFLFNEGYAERKRVTLRKKRFMKRRRWVVGMKEKAEEFVAASAEVYVKA